MYTYVCNPFSFFRPKQELSHYSPGPIFSVLSMPLKFLWTKTRFRLCVSQFLYSPGNLKQDEEVQSREMGFNGRGSKHHLKPKGRLAKIGIALGAAMKFSTFPFGRPPLWSSHHSSSGMVSLMPFSYVTLFPLNKHVNETYGGWERK